MYRRDEERERENKNPVNELHWGSVAGAKVEKVNIGKQKRPVTIYFCIRGGFQWRHKKWEKVMQTITIPHDELTQIFSSIFRARSKSEQLHSFIRQITYAHFLLCVSCYLIYIYLNQSINLYHRIINRRLFCLAYLN